MAFLTGKTARRAEVVKRRQVVGRAAGSAASAAGCGTVECRRRRRTHRLPPASPAAVLTGQGRALTPDRQLVRQPAGADGAVLQQAWRKLPRRRLAAVRRVALRRRPARGRLDGDSRHPRYRRSRPRRAGRRRHRARPRPPARMRQRARPQTATAQASTEAAATPPAAGSQAGGRCKQPADQAIAAGAAKPATAGTVRRLRAQTPSTASPASAQQRRRAPAAIRHGLRGSC